MPPRRAAAATSRARAARPSNSDEEEAAPARTARTTRPAAAATRRAKKVVESDSEEEEEEEQESDEQDDEETFREEEPAPRAKKAAAARQPAARAPRSRAPVSAARARDGVTPTPDAPGSPHTPTASLPVAAPRAASSSAAGPKTPENAPAGAPSQRTAQPSGSRVPSGSRIPSSSQRVPSGSSQYSSASQGYRSAPGGVMQTPRVPSTPRTVAGTPFSVARTPAPVVVEAPKTRLVIHKMVLKDFKSYGGSQTIGPFHKSFSAVVGPNGSGKSNVIDAMLFVFGWRANKMRQGKLSELIHHSEGRDNLPSCTVEVWFREIVDLPGPDAYTVVPGSKLVVSRTAYRNNSSVYALNNAKSTFTEVRNLLRARGIDLDHKRFLILQGEVESIAQMPPKAKTEHDEGLLEYLEDIIGTSEFKTPIDEAAAKVDAANEVRAERLGRLKITQREKESLESKKREAEEFLRNQNELTQRQSALWQVYMLECRDQLSVAAAAIEKIEARRAEEAEKHAGSKAEIDALEAEHAEMLREYDEIARDTAKVVKELARLEKEDVQLQEKRKHLDSKKKKLVKSLSDDKHAISAARSTAVDSQEEIKKVTAEVEALEASLEKQEAELDAIRESLKGKTEGFSAAIEKKQRELQPWAAKISERQNARDVATEERKLLNERAGQAVKEAEDARQALAELDANNAAKRDELESLEKEKHELAKKLLRGEKQVDSMVAQETELRSKARSARTKADEAKSSATSNRSRGEVLNALTRQADLGMLKGFHGRLGNLGVIDDQYDVAISTACPGLDNLVVEGVETGQACIEHLRRNNLGRANFILLNSLPKSSMAPIQTPENVPRLFDLVKPKDPRFAAAFYHQLRDTLVARDLAHANRIAYGAQRWRVVTLDGQLIDKSGTMSGGGARVARGAMSSKFAADDVTPEQVVRLEKERDAAEETLRSHSKSLQDMQALLESQRQRVPQIEVELEKVAMDLGIGERRVQEAKKRVAELQSASGPDDADADRIEELDVQLEALDKELGKLGEKSSAIEADIEALQEKILEAGGVRLRTQKSKVDGIKEMIELGSERTTKAEVAKAKAEKDIAKLEKAIATNTSSLESMEDELAELLETIDSRSAALEGERSKVEAAQEAMEAKREAKDEVKAQLDAHAGSANAFRKLEMELKQKLDDNQRALADNEKRLQHWQDKHAQLRLHRIESDLDDEEGEEGSKASPAPTAENAGDRASAGPEDGAKSRSGKKSREGSVEEEESDDDVDEDLVLQEFPPDELRGIDKEGIKAEIVLYEEQVQKGMGNVAVLEEYRKRELEFASRARDLEETTAARDEAKRVHDDLRKQRLEAFMAGFSLISAKLKEMYQTITLGGNAELELVDSMDPFSEGILFSVMPPKKSWKHISNLSGGEKTLSSLALVFALHAFAPTPLYVLDEVDAALDFKNVSVISSIVASRSSSGAAPAQFVVISHRNDMFERSQRLCGVWKTSGRSRSLAIDNSDMHAPPPPPPGREGSVASTPGMRRSAVPGSAMSSKMVDLRAGPAGRASTASHVPPTPLGMRQRQVMG